MGGVGLGWPLLVALIPRSVLPSLQDSTRSGVPGRLVARPAGLLTAPTPSGGARRQKTPPCLCVSWEGDAFGVWGHFGIPRFIHKRRGTQIPFPIHRE